MSCLSYLYFSVRRVFTTLPSSSFYSTLRAMLPSIYRHFLLFVLVSSLTKVCGQTTPWSLVIDHTRRPNETLSPSKFCPLPSSTTFTDVSQCITGAGSPGITPPAFIHSTLAPATAISHIVAPLRRFSYSLSHDLSPYILGHQFTIPQA
jgi:hypothetical protein